MKDQFQIQLLEHINSFSVNSIIDKLPDILKTPCNYLQEETEKEVFLIGAIGVISGILPNVLGNYSGKWISSNLFVYVLAGYGGGKGGLDFAKALGQQIHDSKRYKSEQLTIEYSQAMDKFKRELAIYKKAKDPNLETPSKPKRPPMLMLYIPANNSKSGIYQLLQENEGKGIIFESEGDTLSDALKQDYGGFSDTFRKAFHHENLSLFRRQGNELIDIKNPELSVVLASTYDQLKTLIPTIENGLFSRFLFYELKQDNRFNNVFESSKKKYQELFEAAGEKFNLLYDELNYREKPIFFWLTDDQERKFLEVFSSKKIKLIGDIDVTMAGTANRLGVIAFRVMMIFSILRAYEHGDLPDNVRCKDVDFENALKIVERFENHAVTVYNYLDNSPKKKDLAKLLQKEGKSYGEISKILFNNDKHKGTIHKWVNKKKNGNAKN